MGYPDEFNDGNLKLFPALTSHMAVVSKERNLKYEFAV
jgi:hypothetical protein